MPPRIELSGIGSSFRAMTAATRRRHLLFPAILAVEFLLVAAFFNEAPASQAPPGKSRSLAMFDVAAPGETIPEPEPEPEPVEVPQPLIVPPTPPLEMESPLPAAPIFTAAAAAHAGFGTTCDVAHTLERGFRDDPLLSGELARIGPQSRSVANAIMFWDGEWSDLGGDTPDDALNKVRRAIVEAVRAAPPECLTQELKGPRFIAVSRSDTTTVLVLGSGTWRWGQLVVEPTAAASPPTRTN